MQQQQQAPRPQHAAAVPTPGAPFSWGGGGVVVHAVAGDVLVVHAGLRGLDAGVRGGEGAYRWLAAASQQRHWGRGHTWRSSRRPEDTGRGEVRRTRAGAGRRRTGLQTWRWAGE